MKTLRRGKANGTTGPNEALPNSQSTFMAFFHVMQLKVTFNQTYYCKSNNFIILAKETIDKS